MVEFVDQLRGLFRFRTDGAPVPIDEVESVESIVKRAVKDLNMDEKPNAVCFAFFIVCFRSKNPRPFCFSFASFCFLLRLRFLAQELLFIY